MQSKYDTTPFGDGVLVGSGGNVTSNVTSHYGNRDTGGTDGKLPSTGANDQLVINFDGKIFADVENTLVEYVIPAGAIIKGVYMDVEEAFAFGGTSAGLDIGTDGSEATNGFSVTEAQLEATNSVNLTSELSGTWDGEAPLAADTTVGFALFGTSPTMAESGKARFVIEYVKTTV